MLRRPHPILYCSNSLNMLFGGWGTTAWMQSNAKAVAENDSETCHLKAGSVDDIGNR